MRFLVESLKDLDDSLKKVGGRLFVFTGDSLNILSHLFQVSLGFGEQLDQCLVLVICYHSCLETLISNL